MLLHNKKGDQKIKGDKYEIKIIYYPEYKTTADQEL